MSWPDAVVAATATVIVFVVAIVAIWQAFKTWQSRIATRGLVAQDEAYRKLAEEATAAQRKIADEQRRMAEDLAEVRSRLAAIEKLLHDVE